MVNIIRKSKADVLCLQGLAAESYGNRASETAVAQTRRLVDWLNKAAEHDKTSPYKYIIAKPKGNGDEAVAFFWCKPVSLESKPQTLEEVRDKESFRDESSFVRTPIYARFSAGKSDFYVVNCHLDPHVQSHQTPGRAAEYAALVGWLGGLDERQEKDAIILGNFNLFSGSKRPWRHIMTADHKDNYRFPLLEATWAAERSFDQTEDEAPSDRHSTTTGRQPSMSDQFIISAGLFKEFGREVPKFGEDVGVVDFDNDDSYSWATGEWSDATAVLSNHRPIWIRIAIDGEDDD